MAITLRAVAQMSSKRCKNSLFVIPYFFTFANAFFGFLSVIEALQGNIVQAACCIGLAACADAFDGRLARAFGSSSYFGAELDGLCDAISFCCAPTILIYSLFQDRMSFFGISILGLYLCAGLFRLAKFNVTQSSCNAYFSGLATPISAFFLATLVLYYDWFCSSLFWFLVHDYGIVCVVGILSVLMVSTIPFPSFKKADYDPSVWYCMVFLCLLCAFAAFYGEMPILFSLLASYISFSIFYCMGSRLYRKIVKRKRYYQIVRSDSNLH